MYKFILQLYVCNCMHLKIMSLVSCFGLSAVCGNGININLCLFFRSIYGELTTYCRYHRNYFTY